MGIVLNPHNEIQSTDFAIGGVDLKIKKLMTVVLLLIMCLNFGSTAFAISKLDYTEKLQELELLINECKEKGYPVDYEMINYSVIKEFQKYINEDIDNGIDDRITQYNSDSMERLYVEAKESLSAYLSGTKKPKDVRRPDYDSMYIDGTQLKDKNGAVFSVGYSHSTQIQKDVDKLHNLGADNIQVEVGPTTLSKYPYGWKRNGTWDMDYEIDISPKKKYSGEYSLMLINRTQAKDNSGSCIRYSQTIAAKRNTTYKYGCYSLGTKINRLTISANAFENRNYIGPSKYWQLNDYQYTTTDSQSELVFNFVCEGITEVFLDDFYLYELDNDGKICSDNLLENPGFENNSAYVGSIKYLLDTLDNAEENNINVSLLLSPHYFPERVEGVSYTDKGAWSNFNIDDIKARDIIEDYLRVLLPLVKDYTAIKDICLSNEASYNVTWFYDFYNPRFQEYLREVHGSIETLNQRYGTNYSSFDEVNMPVDVTNHDAICYDWIQFNDKVFADWHKWMADIVREYIPDKPIHVKMSPNISIWTENEERIFLIRGTDLEMFDEFSDYAGNDSWDYDNDDNGTYFQQTFLYDYQHSVTGKPIYNSEDHPIVEEEDDVWSYNERTKKHMRNHLWMGAIHGRNISTIWQWERLQYTGKRSWCSMLNRPDVAAEVGKTYLDMNLLADSIASLQNNRPKVAIMYSKPSRLYRAEYSKDLRIAYKAMTEIGEKVGIVSDKSIDMLDNYNVLIIPGATNACKETLDKVNEFLRNGGKVIYFGDVFASDEYNNSIDNSYLIANSFEYKSSNLTSVKMSILALLQKFDMAKLTLKYNESGNAPTNIDWQYCVDKDRILCVITSLSSENPEEISLYWQGEKLEGNIHELISDTMVDNSIQLDYKTPVMLEYNIGSVADICKCSLDKNTGMVSWSYSDANYSGANIYRVRNNGTLEFITKETGTEYKLIQEGTYVIKAFKGKREGNGKAFTYNSGIPLILSLDSPKYKDNIFSFNVDFHNCSEDFTSGVLQVKLNYDDGKNQTMNYSFTLPTNKKDGMKLSVPSSERPASITAVIMSDLYSKNLYSNNVLLELK